MEGHRVAVPHGGCASRAQSATKPPAAADDPKPVATVLDAGVITTRQAITPAGIQMVFRGRVYGVAFGSSSDVVYALSGASKGSIVY